LLHLYYRQGFEKIKSFIRGYEILSRIILAGKAVFSNRILLDVNYVNDIMQQVFEGERK